MVNVFVRHNNHEAVVVAHHRFDAIIVDAMSVQLGRVGGAKRAKLWLRIGHVGSASRQDVLAIGGSAFFYAFIMVTVVPGYARTGIAVMADKGAPRILGIVGPPVDIVRDRELPVKRLVRSSNCTTRERPKWNHP